MNTKPVVLIVLMTAVIGGGAYFLIGSEKDYSHITNFAECGAAGFPIMESYPERCATPDGRVFVNDVQNGTAIDPIQFQPPSGFDTNLSRDGAVALVRSYIAGLFGVPESEVVIVSAVTKDFPDACLGVAAEGVLCAQVITAGYEIVTRVGTETMTFRAAANGTAVVPVP